MARKNDTDVTEMETVDPANETPANETVEKTKRSGAEKFAEARETSKHSDFDIVGFCEAVASKIGINLSDYMKDDE